MNKPRINRIVRIVFSLALLPTGGLLVVVAPAGSIGELISSLGLSLIVAGVISIFRELALTQSEKEETGEEIAAKVHDKLIAFPPSTAIRLVAPVRRGYEGYYPWAMVRTPQDLFFAGRSVLHRIEDDFKKRSLAVEQVLVRKLKEGSVVRILFLDPRSDIIKRLANEEGQTEAAMLSDIATSINVCRKTYKLLCEETDLHPRAQLYIRLYDEIPYFAYHKEDSRVIVGFYFTTYLGSESSAFEVVDPQAQKRFEEHFTAIFNKASDKAILELSVFRGKPTFNETLFTNLYHALCANDKLGEEKTERILGRLQIEQ